jgi:lysophospholipase
MARSWLAFAFVVLCPGSFAAEPTDFPTAVEALQKLPEMHSFDAADGSHLVYSVIHGSSPGRLGPLVISEGKGETAFRYLKFAAEMQAKGYGPVFILDHRGQGFSQQVIANSVHVDDFHVYVKDFIQFMDGPVKKTLAEQGIKAKPFIVGHSMGGAILNLSLRERPDLARRAAYVTPMFRIDLGGTMEKLDNKPAEWASSGLRRVGLGKVTFGGNVDDFPHAASEVHRHLQESEKLERVLNVRTPRESLAWLNEALKAGDDIRDGGSRPPTPSIFFTGTKDHVVSGAAIRDYACGSGQCAVELDGAHPLHQERDPVRTKLEDDIDAFFQGRPVSCENLYGKLGK